MSARRGATGLSGVLAVDKPRGMTSHDVVAVVRRATGERRVGHAGTLDPLATGLMTVLVGPATRLEPYLSGHDKTYVATIAFGQATDTDDADGTVTSSMPVPREVTDPDAAARLLATFIGPQEQMPPAYSAIKQGGQIAHRAARAGKPLTLDARSIVVHSAELIAIHPGCPAWDVRFTVTKGTYIRSLARDIGTRAGTRAHITALRRTATGTLSVDCALPLSAFDAPLTALDLATRFIDPVSALGLPALSDVDAVAVAAGRAVPLPQHATLEPSGLVALCAGDRLLAIYRRDGDRLVPTVVLAVPAQGVRR
jgi:tRNA pseudouridine55 synthase